MRRISALFAFICVVLCMFSGCSKYRQIEVTGVKVEGVSIVGLRAVNLTLAVGIDNPAGKLDVREAYGYLKHFGKVIGKVTLNPFIVNAQTNRNHTVTARVELSKDVGFKQLMSLLNVDTLYECDVDIHVKGFVAGIPLKKDFKDMPLKELL